MTRSRTFLAFLLPTALAGGVLLQGVSSRADDDDSDVTVYSGDDDSDNDGTAMLNIATNPPVEVFIDGESYGHTPIHRRIEAGKHKLVLVGPNGKKTSKVIVVDAGSNVNIAQNYSGAGGSSSSSSSSGGASADAWAWSGDPDRMTADQARAAADQARAAADEARAQLEQARAEIESNGSLSPKMRDAILKRLDKAQKVIDKHLKGLKFNGDWDDFGQQMEAFGESMGEAFQGMDADFADLDEVIAKQVQKALKHGLKGGIRGGIQIDLGDDDDPVVAPLPPLPPTAPVPPVPPVPSATPPDFDFDDAYDLDMSDMDLSIDLGSLGLSGSQSSTLRSIIEDEQRAVQPAEQQLEQLSEQLRDTLENDDVDEAQIGALVDKMAEREAQIRKARLLAWAKARKLLDDDQRKKVHKAARRHGP
jgi:Spy/CpxP family protein refolding chaperone